MKKRLDVNNSAVINPAQARDRHIARESVYVAAIGLFLSIAGLWQQSFINFESRFALFAQEMLRHGPALFPTTYGEPYPDYPVTGTLLIWLCSLPFGAVTKFSAVLPTAIASALNYLLLYRLLAPLSRRWAVTALCMQLMTVTYLAEARSLSLDLMVGTITLLGFYVVHSATSSGRASLLRWLPLLLLAGFAVRGPLGVVVPAGVIAGYYAVENKWRALLRFGLLALGVLIIAWAALLALSAKLYGVAFAWDVANMQVFGRLDSHEPGQPFYYFTSSLGNYALAYPLALLVSIAIALRTFNIGSPATNRLLRGLIVWVAVVMIGLSIPHVKKVRYLLPIVPALAALAAYPWYETPTRLLQWIKIISEKIFALLPFIIAIALAIVHHRAKHHHGDVHLPMLALYVGLTALQVAAGWIYFKSTSQLRSVRLIVVAAATLWFVAVVAVEPAQRQLHDTATFVAQVEALRAQKPGELALFGMTQDGEAIKYLVNTPYDLKPHFVRDAAGIDALEHPVYVMISDSNIGKAAAADGKNRLLDSLKVLTANFEGHPFSVFYLP